jgi:hypothetical protein
MTKETSNDGAATDAVPAPELNGIRNEVLRKIGRNVMLFQQMEHLLKVMLAKSSVSVSLDSKTPVRPRQADTKTLGQLVGSFQKDVMVKLDEMNSALETSETLDVLGPPKMSMTWNIGVEEDFREEFRSDMKIVVDERNELIHLLLPKWDPTSMDGCREVDGYLDRQREKVLPTLNTLIELWNNLRDAQREMLEFIASDEGKEQIRLDGLRQSQLVACLYDIAQRQARPDGWVALSTAAQTISENVPRELSELKKRHGYKKLKDAILATEWFDISEELTSKGGRRVLYRIKPDLVNFDSNSIM